MKDFSDPTAGKTLTALAVPFLQFAGPKLLEPFKDFVDHVWMNKAVYNPPIYDNPPPFEPTFHVVLGGHIGIKPLKKGKITKMNFASGSVGTAPDFIKALGDQEKGIIY